MPTRRIPEHLLFQDIMTWYGRLIGTATPVEPPKPKPQPLIGSDYHKCGICKGEGSFLFDTGPGYGRNTSDRLRRFQCPHCGGEKIKKLDNLKP